MKKRHGFFAGSKRSDSLDEGSIAAKDHVASAKEYRQLVSRAEQLQAEIKNDKNKPETRPRTNDLDRKYSDFLTSLAQKRRPDLSRPETGSSSSDSEPATGRAANRKRSDSVESRHRGGGGGESVSSRRNSLSTIPDTDVDFGISSRHMGAKKLAPIAKPSIKIDETPRPARTKPLLIEKGDKDVANYLLGLCNVARTDLAQC